MGPRFRCQHRIPGISIESHAGLSQVTLSRELPEPVRGILESVHFILRTPRMHFGPRMITKKHRMHCNLVDCNRGMDQAKFRVPRNISLCKERLGQMLSCGPDACSVLNRPELHLFGLPNWLLSVRFLLARSKQQFAGSKRHGHIEWNAIATDAAWVVYSSHKEFEKAWRPQEHLVGRSWPWVVSPKHKRKE